MVDLLPFVVLAFAGALHCAGMCGAFALACGTLARDASGSVVAHRTAYIVGKALTYGILGLAAHAGVAAFAHGSGGSVNLRGAHALATWVCGAMLVLLGLRELGVRFPARATHSSTWRRLGTRGRRAFDTSWRAVRSLPGPTSSLGVGLLNGLLPCGLSASAILLAATVPRELAFAGPFLFGIATAPALLLVATLGRMLRGGASPFARRWLGPTLIVLGVWTVARGTLSGAASLAPPCCAASSELP